MLFVLLIGGSVFIVLLYLWMIKPGRYRDDIMKPFERVYIAHRGLFDDAEGIPENSLPAFRRAVEQGYGIELDIQRTKDRHLVVFHDRTLERMCGENKVLTEMTLAEIQEYTLGKSKERIPLFEEVLDVVGGRVPIVVEIKPDGHCFAATADMCKRMENYHGEYCMESFHPLCVWWVRMHYPKVARGQLSMNFFIEEAEKPFHQKLVMTSLVLNLFARPDFIAYKHSQRDQFSYKLLRRLYRVTNAAWTIKSQEQLNAAKDTFQVMIFDSFIPKKDF